MFKNTDRVDLSTIKEQDKASYDGGYTILRDGRIINCFGRELHPYFFSYPDSHVTLRINDKVYKKNRAVLIYDTFNDKPFDRKNNVLVFKDGDKGNPAFDNLKEISRKEFYALNKEKHNGKPYLSSEMCSQIIADYKKGDTSIRKLSVKYGCAVATIQRIIRSQQPK